MPSISPERVRLGVSACLLGERVRYDGGHKRDQFLTDILGPFVEWVPVCPEVEIGLTTPRDNLRLVGTDASARMVVQRTGEDITRRMERYAREKLAELEGLELDGYVLKRASPSCGLFRVRVYHDNGGSSSGGRGLFAAALVHRLPLLPVEEEGRLMDAAIRENFIERVFGAARRRAFVATAPRARDMVAFHAAQTLGRVVARAGRTLTKAALAEYAQLFTEALAVRATRPRQVNVLQHLAGFFKKQLGADERAEPDKELMLRNHV